MIDRIKHLMDFKGMTAAMFADAIGVNRSSLTHLFTGRNQPSLDLAKKILTAFPEVKTEWLIMGMGDMLGTTAAPNVNPPLQSKEATVENSFPVTLDLFADEALPSEIQPQAAPVAVESAETPLAPLPAEHEPVSSEVQPSVSAVRKSSTKNKAIISEKIPQGVQKNDSRQVKTVKKIVFLYADNTFEVFYPTKNND